MARYSDYDDYASPPPNIEMSCIVFLLCCIASAAAYWFVGYAYGGGALIFCLGVPAMYPFLVPSRQRRGVMMFAAGVYALGIFGTLGFHLLKGSDLSVAGGLSRVQNAFVPAAERDYTPEAPNNQYAQQPPGSFAPSQFTGNSGVRSGAAIPLRPNVQNYGGDPSYGTGAQPLPPGIGGR